MNGELETIWKGIDHGLIEVVCRNMPEWTEKKTRKPSGNLVCAPAAIRTEHVANKVYSVSAKAIYAILLKFL
jgi:hypothetical protein